MMRRKRTAALALLSLLFVAAAHGQRAIPRAPSSFVHDEVGWLDRGEQRRLSETLRQYERDTSNQIVVAIFRSLDGEALGDYSQRVAEAWGLGQGDRDNGILVAVYAEDRQISIEVGYGLEGAVTDLIAAQILDERLRPAFRAGRYYDGLSLAVNDLMAAAAGEYVGSGRARGDREPERRRGLPWWILFPLILMFFGGGRGLRSNMLGAVLLSSAMGGGRSRGGFGGGGFGGGGFSGGGGSFGGGGARGGW